MASASGFQSRKGVVSATPRAVFEFVTDLRNFRQFVPENRISSLEIDKESCSFSVPVVGNVNVRLAAAEPYSRVAYSGKALQDNEFSLTLEISGPGDGTSEVRLFLEAELNPILKMMATEPIGRFLETLVDEMEKFTGWSTPNQ